MKIPFEYNIRNLRARPLTTGLAMGGITLVAFMFAAVLMLARGLEETMARTGSPENVIFIRKGTDGELTSIIPRDIVSLLQAFPEIALSPEGKPAAVAESVVIINLYKKGSSDLGNVTVRGTSPEAFRLRPQLRIAAGRIFRPGTPEVIVGASVARRFQGCGLGQTLSFGGRAWTVVGILDARRSAFESEIWGDAELLMRAFGRNGAFSSMTARLRRPGDRETLRRRLESDLRLKEFQVLNEVEYYEAQSKALALFIRILGLTITWTFSVGAAIGAMITMYAAVAHRIREIGTLRALGFHRRDILLSFLTESLLIALAGGGLGIGLALFLQSFTLSTTNFSTFSEVTFGFRMTPGIAFRTLAFAACMGVLGGSLPALRAARTRVVEALRLE